MNPSVWYLDVSERPTGDSKRAREIMAELKERRAIEYQGGALWRVEYAVHGTDEPGEETMIGRVEGELRAIDARWETHLQVNGIPK